ncbi:MAG: cytochrome c oxidase accessory protein CcoG [Chitinophagaceae bacterium]|nr:cytochrome c oxidase accessory protein CcoG [Chitinophagaceae bacterium]MBK8788244.1 cytochrome c oxidase accessory protein CcoG [Chitinophagaceae bacterium]MBK9486360.1 cytochrome c oxidase accessory protein CcoG [Chitinophagaceae bacterium]MBL0202269.1 cytochrome c oxidase accessory protein CcoG [Chitinophagaceae bacterium]
MTETTDIIDEESFRDSVATISSDGHRNFINPKKPKGKLYNLRTWFSIGYLIVFFTLPFIKVHEAPLFMFNILERKFIFFGVTFWPQDFFIFAIGFLTFMVFIILFTVVFGRVFCGWACPQTIFMEMVFRKIEYWIDGDSAQQKKLRAMPWNGEKIRKRTTKFITFFAISFLIANFFLAYLIGMDELIGDIKNPGAHTGTLISLLVFTTVFFFVYWWFREQVCLVVCPYGRLQGVLLDKNSIVVAYDHQRGEPRGKLKKADDHDCKCTDCKEDGACKSITAKLEAITRQGDCIDCFACVRVCPTAIDIRNGTQLECVNCTACIDACDDIMVKVDKPKGLIRYASENSITNGVKLKLNRRIKAYTAVLMLLLSLLVFLLTSRTDLDVTLMRTSGMTYTTLPDGRLSNLYNLKLANKTHKDIDFSLKLENMPGEIELVGSGRLNVKKGDYSHLQFFVKLNKQEVKNWKTEVKIGVYEGTVKIKTIKAKFIGPEMYN